jgi:5-methylcytosine-specific restriction endonuclease McrA
MVKTCGYCQHPGPHETVQMKTGVHHAKLECGECQRFIAWIPKPATDPTKHKRPKAHTDLVLKFSRGYCELCGFDKDQLPYSETLHAHHVARYCEDGEATRENTWILCTACHALVEHQRTYRGKMHRAIAGDLEAIREAMTLPPTGETLEDLVARKRREQTA